MSGDWQDLELCRLLISLSSAERQERQAAEQALEGVKSSSGFAARLSGFGACGPNSQDALPLRTLALTILRQITQKNWAQLTAADQAACREAMLRGLCEVNASLQALLFVCIANVRSAGAWPELDLRLSNGLRPVTSNSSEAVACVECIVALLDEGNLEVVKSLSQLQAPLLQLVSAEISPELQRSCVRAHVSSVTSIMTSVQGEAAQEAVESSLPGWLQAYAKLCEGHSSWSPSERIKSAFSALQAVTSLCRFRELDAAISEQLEAVLRPACLLVQNLLPDYEVVVQNDDQGQSEEEGGMAPFVAQTMELIQVMANRSKLKALLKNRVKNLIQLFAPFMRITEAQANAWRNDPNEYLQQEEDDHFRGCMVRLSGEGLISALLESFKREASKCLAAVVQNLIEKGEAERAAGDGNAWKLTELGLLMFGIAVEEASVKALQRSDLGPFVPVALSLAARLSGDQAVPEFLRARAFSLLHRLGDTVTAIAAGEVPRLLEAAASGLAPREPLIVRVSACRVFCRFLTATADESLREELLLKKGVLSSLGALLRDADEELLHLCLECLCIIVKKCPNTMAAVDSDLCPLTVQIWRRCAADPMVHMQVLDLVSCCVSTAKRLQRSMEESLLPLVHADLQSTDSHLASSAMELFGVLLKHSDVPFADAIVTCARLLLAKAMQSDESMMLQNACETLVSLVQRSPAQGGELLEPLLRFAERLLGPDLEDDACLYVGPLAMLLFANYGRMLPVQLQVGLLQALVLRLARAERPYLRQELVVVFARLLHEDLNGSLNALANMEVSGSTHGGLQLLMSTWMACAPEIRARRARNITVSALCRVHERCKEDSQLQQQLGDAAPPDRLLQAILAGLEFENLRCSQLQEASAKAIEDSEDEDEDDDDGKDRKQNVFLSDFLDLEDIDSDGSDAADAFQELERKDPLAEMDLPKVLVQYLAAQEPQITDAAFRQRMLKAMQEATSFAAMPSGGYQK